MGKDFFFSIGTPILETGAAIMPGRTALKVSLPAMRQALLLLVLGAAASTVSSPSQLPPVESTGCAGQRLATRKTAAWLAANEAQRRCSKQQGAARLRGGRRDDEKLNIVFVSAEVAPWSVTGGLGAVCDGLPRALSAAGHRVMSIAPRYDQYYDAWDTEFSCEVPLGEGTTRVRFFHAYKKGVDRVFVDHPLFLERVWGMTKQKLYGPKWGKDWEDNQLRFAMLCRAAMAATDQLPLGGAPYGQDVVFVANDWQAALVPMFLKQEQSKGAWQAARCAVLVHNMVFQGRFPADAGASGRLGLSPDLLNQMAVEQPLKLGRHKDGTPHPAQPAVNFLLGALKTADLVLTVSPQYAREVASDVVKGAGLQQECARVGVSGILNGVEDVVRPDNAVLGLTETYDKSSIGKKQQVKTAMQSSLGLAVDPGLPMFLFMGRLDGQKGVDVLFEAMSRALAAGLQAQFLIMGSGVEALEEMATTLEDSFPERVRAILSFKGAEKYRTFAAADFALMPSRYEPCGLVQMEGMRFGTVPIVAPTGGLADTVAHLRTGLVLEKEIDPHGVTTADVAMIIEAMAGACRLFRDAPAYRAVQQAAMEAAAAYTWRNSAVQYLDKFRDLW